ncbi:MAG: hypothetical protein H7288_21450, partial [Kineosporiaceae bacterium]|nr:hypothetical protein [Aeromicrobium sp.]
KILEEGHYIVEGGINFSAVRAVVHGGAEYGAVSDRDSGLWIFKYNG